MPLPQAETDRFAVALREAYAGKTIPPIRDAFETGDVAGAYAVQEVNTAFWLGQGRKLVGRKIGLTSEAVQKQLGVDQPDYGMLFDDMEVRAGGTVPKGKLIQPKVEAEIAFILKSDLAAPKMTEADVKAAVEWVIPALEIVDSRIDNWKISIVDTIADNASSGMYVLGKDRHRPEDVDVVGCQMELLRGTEKVSQGSGAACLGSPYIATLWLAEKLVEMGRPLRKGDVVLSGALGPMVAAAPGNTYQANVTGIGSVSVSF